MLFRTLWGSLVVGACACGGAAAETSVAAVRARGAATPASAPPGASPAFSAAAAPADSPVFTNGCDTKLPNPLPPRVELVRSMGEERWEWACRAVAKLGRPRLRESGYPDFHVRDRLANACVTLSLEDIGAFIYYAPPGRGEALRDLLLGGGAVPDCTFEIGLDGSGIGPRRVGLRAGKPFEEPMYAIDTFVGARAYFDEHPSEHSAAALINTWLELPAKERPQAAEPRLGRAVELELEAFARMDRAWLSDIGKAGYCSRTRQLVKLPVAPELKERLDAEIGRFCR